MKIDSLRTQGINLNNKCILFKSRPVEKKLCVDTFSYFDKFSQECNNKKLIRDLKEYFLLKKGRLKESDVVGIAGQGLFSKVFKLTENRVLKCSLENPLEYRKHCAEFDIPFLSEVEKIGDYYFVIEPKASTKSVTKEDCKDVIKRIYQSGYEPSVDLGEYTLRQVGIYDGKPYLLDTRAAVPQPNRFSKFIYDFCSSYQRVFRVKVVDINKIEAGFGHVDESPRENLQFWTGVKKAFEVIDENVKHGFAEKPEGIGLKYYILIESVIQKIKGIFDKK